MAGKAPGGLAPEALRDRVRILQRGTFLRFEFDMPNAWGYVDLPIPVWILRFLHLKFAMDNYGRSD